MKRLTAFFLSIVTLLFGMMPALQAAAATPTNLIANPSVETSSNGTSPDSWLQGGWGTNTPTFSYLNTGHTGSHSIQVQMSNYTSGDAKWYFAPVAVTAGTTYNFSDYYEATVPTDVVVQLDNGSGTYDYIDMGDVAAATAWTQVSDSFTVPAGFTEATVFHLINSNGTLTTDDYNLSASPNLAVQVTSPTNSTSVSGKAVNLAASASSTDGVTSVQFAVDGKNIGTPVTSAPYATTWDSTTVTNGTHTITATALDSDGQTLTSSAVTVTVNNPVSAGTNLIPNPSVETSTNGTTPDSWQTGGWGTNTTTFSYPSTGAENGTRSLEVKTTAYTSGDAKWYFSPVAVTAGAEYTFSDYYKASIATDVMAQFTDGSGNISYLDLGSAASSASAWKQYTATFTVPAGIVNVTIFHLISGVGTLQTDNFSLTQVDTPTVALTAPTASASVSGSTVSLSATAQDISGVKNVQFQVDGVNVGNPITAAPYTTTWDSTTVANGTHSVTAVATNNNGNTATSAPVSVTVNNATSGNMITNPSVETASPTNANMPLDWQNNTWGTSSVSFAWLKTGGHTGNRAVQVTMSKYSSGDAKWFANPVPVTADTQYEFSDWYKSTVNTEVDVAFDMSDGSTIYQIIGLPDTNGSVYKQFSTTFTVPQGAVDMTVYHLIHSNGSLTVDDEDLQPYKPVGFNRALVTLTFDDGYSSTYDQGLPVLQKYGFNSTQFIITDLVGTTGYMTTQELLSLKADGEEIASHTVTHDDMLTETQAQYTNELSESKTQLQQWIGSPVTDMAYPNGLYDGAILSTTKKYYTGARGVEDGLNSKDNLNAMDLKVQNIYNTTTTAQVADWVAQAQATNTWLILVYHSVDSDTTSSVDGGIYNVTPTQLDSQLAAIKSSGITVETMAQGLAETQAQE